MTRLPARIETEWLLLRHWSNDDVEAFGDAIASSYEHLRPFLSWAAPLPASVDEPAARFDRWHREWADGGDTVLAIMRDGLATGSCGFHRLIGPRGLEIGYWIRSGHTGLGYATEAARALTAAAFDVDEIDRVEIQHDKANVASAGVPIRMG